MKLLKRSLTGNYDYYQSDIGLVLVRCDYNADQPRDSRGRWTSGGGGGGGGASAPRKAWGGGGFTTAELTKKKVSELEQIAKEVGAASPTKYKNRKSSWIAEIQKVKGGGDDVVTPPIVKPLPKLGRFTAEELGKKKLTDLERIAKEVGAEIPAKYKNRKSSWIAEIEKAQGKRGGETPPTPPPPPKPTVYKAAKFTHTELRKSGESYAKQFLDDSVIKIPPSARESELLATKKAIGAELRDAVRAGDTKKASRLTVDFHKVEGEYQKLYQDRKAKERQKDGYVNLEKAIREQSAITRQEAERLANSVTLDPTLSRAQAKTSREALADFYELTGGRGSTSLNLLKYDDPRAYASRSGVVNIGDGSRATLYHEFGHHAEYVSTQLLESAIAWRNGKATSKKPEKLSKLTGNKGYGDDEVAMPDKFVDPYVGKVYDSYFGEKATEVVSMGVERFHSPEAMKEFREKDPDHFHFILGVLTNREN